MASRDEWSTLCKAFGAAVRTRREELDLSQEELGIRAGEMDRTYVSGIERGVRNPTLKIIGRLAKALHTKPSKLLASADNQTHAASARAATGAGAGGTPSSGRTKHGLS